MKKLTDAIQWLDTHQESAYSLIRIFLGTALFIRGWIFFSDPAAITELARAEKLYMWFSYVTIAHLVGGFLMAIGLQTRLAGLFQIPILVAAVFVVHADQGLMSVGQSMELAVLVLILLVIYALFGSGILSVDKYFVKKRQQSVPDTESSGVPA